MTEQESQASLDTLDEALITIHKAVQEAREEKESASRIVQAAKGGTVKPAHYRRDVAPGYDGRIRELVEEVIFAKWNEKKEPCKLLEVYNGVRAKIPQAIKEGTWAPIWDWPSKRTVDRRTNETTYKEFAGEEGIPRILMLKAGTYGVSPALFEDEVREKIIRRGSE